MSGAIPPTLALYRRFRGWPMGGWIFARAVSFRAPYFASISPRVLALEPGRCEVAMRKRRSVQNHIGTVHAIACCNLCELAAGLVSEATVPVEMRWIPRGMQVEYLKKADSDLRAVCTLEAGQWSDGMDVTARAEVFTTTGVCAVRAAITLYISAKRAR